MKNQNSLWSMRMVVLIQTISAAASCLIHSFSAPISGTVQIEIKRTNRGSRISQFRNGLHNFAFIFFLQKREKIVQNLISFYNMAFWPWPRAWTPWPLNNCARLSEWLPIGEKTLIFPIINLYRKSVFDPVIFFGKKGCQWRYFGNFLLHCFSMHFFVFKCNSLTRMYIFY